MDVEYFREVYELSRDVEDKLGWPHHEFGGNPCYLGLQIIAKYVQPKHVVMALEHDVLFSTPIDELAEGGITAEEIIELVQMGWCISDYDSMAYYM